MTTEDQEVERYVREYGEPYRRLIEDALDFLKGKAWVENVNLDVADYIHRLVTDPSLTLKSRRPDQS